MALLGPGGASVAPAAMARGEIVERSHDTPPWTVGVRVIVPKDKQRAA